MSRSLSSLACALCLIITSCFVSQTPLISQAALITDQAVRFCTSDEEPCHETERSGDGYLVLPAPDDAEDEGPVLIRFTFLTMAGELPVWLGEAQLDSADSERLYVLARFARAAPGGVDEFHLVLPDCAEAGPDERARLGLTGPAGGGTCRIDDLDALKDYLIARHGADFADPDWWVTPS